MLLLRYLVDFINGFIAAVIDLWPCDLETFGYLVGLLSILALVAFCTVAPLYIIYISLF